MKIELPDFSKAQVLVIGDVMLDRYWHGQASRISPEAPVPVVHVEHVEEIEGEEVKKVLPNNNGLQPGAYEGTEFSYI